MELNTKNIGTMLIGFSIALLILLALVKSNFDYQSGLVCNAYHVTNPGSNMQTCPAHQGNLSWLITVAFGVAFLILGLGLYMIFARLPESAAKKEFKPVDESKLDEEEKAVYDKVKEKGGSAYQSDVIKETGLTKVRVSRILDKLEGAGVVERKRRGMTNIVVLK